MEINYQPYRKKEYFFSVAELKFYNLLRDITPEKYLLFAKVRICDLIQPQPGKEKYSYFNKIKSKHVDFVVCNQNPITVKTVIELDDSSHQRSSRQERDNFVDEAFLNAGVPIVHIPVQAYYDKNEIINQIKQACEEKYIINYTSELKTKVYPEWWQNCLATILSGFTVLVLLFLAGNFFIFGGK